MGARGVRVVAGRYRGLRLTVPAGREVRPTADRVKEAWFSILGERVRDATVVDLFAGSGALGIEALSRGAARVLFVEKARKPLMTLEANLARLEGAADRVRVAAADVFHPHRWVDAGNPPALILADPPYRRNLVARLLESLAEEDLPTAAGLLAVEHERTVRPAHSAWTLRDSRHYGETTLSFLTRANAG